MAVCELQRTQRRSTFPRGAGRACKTCRRPGPRCVLSTPSTHPASLSSEETSRPTSAILTGAFCRASTYVCLLYALPNSPLTCFSSPPLLPLLHPLGSTLTAMSTIPVTFVMPGGERIELDAPIGDSMLDVAHDNDVELEGACGGELACSTCHVILSEEMFDSMPPPEEEEEDMLDLAFDLTDTYVFWGTLRSLQP